MTIPKITASQKVVDHILENLSRPGWNAGDRIPSESELAQTLGVSRSSIRPAIQRFVALGILESIQGKGTFIVSTERNPPFSSAASPGGKLETLHADMPSILEFRAALEPAAAALAAARAGRSVSESLQRHLHAQVASIGDSENFIRHDMLFHIEVCRASGNPLMERGIRDLLAPTVRAHEELARTLGYKDSVYYHSLIHKAIERGDAGEARSIMSDYFALITRGFRDASRS